MFALFSATAHAQRPAAPQKFQVTVSHDGPEIFARILDHAGLEPIASIDRFKASPADKTILIVFGDPAPLIDLDKKKGLSGFLNMGGTMLVATDRPFSFKEVRTLGWDDVHIENRVANFVQNLAGEPDCPTITRSEFRQPEHPLFRDVTKPIATNCPAVATINRRWQTLATLPPNTVSGPLRDKLGRFPGRGSLGPYLVTPGPDEPRALLVAGHGVFMNSMMVRDDIDNRRLALNAIQWLKDGKRTHVLFINEGKVVETFKMPLTGPPKMPMPTMTAINRIIDAIQNERILQKALDKWLGPDRIVRGLLIVVTFGILLYGMKKYFQSRWSLAATPAIVGAPPPKMPSVVKQQVREMVRRQQLGEPAQALARDWFRGYAKVDFPAGQPPQEISFDIHAGVMQRRKLAKHVKTLWALASGPPPADWDTKKLRDLSAFLEELSLSVLAGEVVFDSPVGPSPRS